LSATLKYESKKD